MGINQFGDGMFSEIIEASTKGKWKILSNMKNKLTSDQSIFRTLVLIAIFMDNLEYYSRLSLAIFKYIIFGNFLKVNKILR